MYRQILWLILLSSISALSHAAIVVANTQNFNSRVSSMNSCYLSSKTDCNGVDMSSYYWSNDPKAYWEQVHQSLGSTPNNTQSQPLAPATVAPITISVPPLPLQEKIRGF